MRKALLLAVILGGGLSLYTTEASARVVCARGVHAAGCVGPRGAVVARRSMGRRGATVRSSTTVNRRRGTVTHRRTVIR